MIPKITDEEIKKLASERYPDENIGTMRKQWLFVKDVKWAINRLSPTRKESEEVKTINDGCDSEWTLECAECGKDTMQVVRPGKAQCSNCG